jgi:hypothetical protein
MNTRERVLMHSVHVVGLQVERFHVGRYRFYQIKSPAQNMSQPLTIGEAESWVQGYLAAAAKVVGVVR